MESDATHDLPLTRRAFTRELGASASFLAAGNLGALALPLSGDAPRLAVPHGRTASWDMSWVDKLKGKYRAVFDSPDINDGTAFVNATFYILGYREVYGAADEDIQAVIVMRGNGVHMALGADLWDKYDLGRQLGLGVPTNPYLQQMAALRKRGAILLACNLAANFYADGIARRINADSTVVREQIRTGLAPGVILMPSGVFSVLRAQQAGCWFLKSA